MTPYHILLVEDEELMREQVGRVVLDILLPDGSALRGESNPVAISFGNSSESSPFDNLG